MEEAKQGGSWRERWRGLTRVQKISAAVLAGALVLSLCLALGLRTSAEHQTLVEIHSRDAARDLQEILGLLDKNRIPWRSVRLADGGVRITVPAGESFQQAFYLTAEHGLSFGAAESSDWTSGNALFPNPREMKQRREEALRRDIEKSICWNPSIASAKLFISRRPEPRYAAAAKEPDSAAVHLKLRMYVTRLAAREAATIREMVTRAFGIAPEKVSITDHNGHSYTPSGEHIEEEETARRRIEEVVTRLYLKQYQRHEFRVAVLLDPSSATVPGDGNDGLAKGGTQGSASELQSAAADAGREVSIEKAAFSDKPERKVSVSLLIDVEAVKRTLLKRDAAIEGSRRPGLGDLKQRLTAYTAEQEDFLGKQLGPGAVVNVKAEVFVSAFPAAAAPPDASGGTSRWLAEAPAAWFWAGGVLALAIIAVLIKTRRRRRGLSIAADSSLTPSLEGLSVCGETIEAVRAAGKAVEERPEVAASILRLWLAEGKAVVPAGETPATAPPVAAAAEKSSQEVLK